MAALAQGVRRRQAVALSAAALTGLGYAVVLLVGLDTTYDPPPIAPAPVRVSFSDASPPLLDGKLTQTLAQLPINVPTPHWESLSPPVLTFPDEPTQRSRVPKHHVFRKQPNQALREIDVPPLELSADAIPEQPGGDVAVIAVLVDSEGYVRNTKILVTSADPIADMRALLSLPARVKPPAALPPGTVHWVYLRFRFKDLSTELP